MKHSSVMMIIGIVGVFLQNLTGKYLLIEVKEEKAAKIETGKFSLFSYENIFHQ